MQPNNNGNPNPQPPIWQQPPPLYPVPPAPPIPQSEPQLPEPQTTEPSYPPVAPAPAKPSSRRRRVVLGLIGLIAALLVLIVLYTTFFKGNDGAPVGGQSNVQLSPLSSLSGASLLPPADLSRYQPNGQNSGTTMQYATANDECTLEMGIADKNKMPGKDFKALVDARLKQHRDKKQSVDGPKKADDLQLLDASDSTKGYSLQTVTYTVKEKNSFTHTRFSAAVLKNDQRAYVIRSCKGDDAAKNTPLNAIDKDARTAAVIAG